MRFAEGGRSYICLVALWSAGLADSPSECVATHLSRDAEREMRVTRLQFIGTKQFEKNSDEVLRDIIASERRKGRADLSRRAMNGRNEDQEKQPLPHRTELRIESRSKKFEQDFVGRWARAFVLMPVKVLDEFERGRKPGQYYARCGELPELFAVLMVPEFSNQADLQPADETVAVRPGHQGGRSGVCRFRDRCPGIL